MHTIMRHGLAIAAVLLVGCGGGGGGDAAPVLPSATSFNANLEATSYRNFKEAGLTPVVLPASRRFGSIRAYGDFFGNGRADVFIAQLTYSPTTSTPATASAALFEFWRKEANGTFTYVADKVSGGIGCIHPRKGVVADFNHDGRPDIAVACHGYDASPFPGERMKIVLSESDGRYRVQDLSTDVGFFHNVAAGDLDGDGWADLVAVNNFDAASAFVLLNQRNGTFQREALQRLPADVAGKQYFTVELLDVDGDGKADLFFGGHEWTNNTGNGSSPTVVFVNPGTGNFLGVSPSVVPAIPGQGVVLDATATGSGADRALWVLRTSGGGTTFYQGRLMQRVAWPSLASTTPYVGPAVPWTPWVIPATLGGVPSLVSDDAQDGVVVPI
jgi:hypothetical protein